MRPRIQRHLSSYATQLQSNSRICTQPLSSSLMGQSLNVPHLGATLHLQHTRRASQQVAPRPSTFHVPTEKINAEPISISEFSKCFSRIPLNQALPTDLPQTGLTVLPICVAVSGGVDSMCTVLLWHQYCLQHNTYILTGNSPDSAFVPHPDLLQTGALLLPFATSVDHALRAPSSAETVFVRSTLESLGMRTILARLAWPGKELPPTTAAALTMSCTSSPSPASARLMRYAALLRVGGNAKRWLCDPRAVGQSPDASTTTTTLSPPLPPLAPGVSLPTSHTLYPSACLLRGGGR